MSDLKAHAEKHIAQIQARIEEKREIIKQKSKKLFDEIEELEKEIAPIKKLLSSYNKEQKAASKASK